MWIECSYEYSSVLLAMLSIQGCFLFWSIVWRNMIILEAEHTALILSPALAPNTVSQRTALTHISKVLTQSSKYTLLSTCAPCESQWDAWVGYWCAFSAALPCLGEEALKSFLLTVPISESDKHKGLDEWKVWIFNLRKVREASSFRHLHSLGQAVFWNHLKAGSRTDLSKEWCID